jgi:hypothetical protein
MPECTLCGDYTKFEGGLCYSCYKAENNPQKSTSVAELPEEEYYYNGLSDRDRNYRYNMIKGRIAETLIQELFLSLGYNVFRYGMENTIPGIMELLKGVRNDVASQIRRMPDIVNQNPESKEVYFVEVKFRANGELCFKDLPKNYPYENAYFILVSKKHIKCITYQELKEGKEITATSRNYLGSRKEFYLQKEVIIDFCDFAVQFFEGV